MNPSGQLVGLGRQREGFILQSMGGLLRHHGFHREDIHASSYAGYKVSKTALFRDIWRYLCRFLVAYLPVLEVV